MTLRLAMAQIRVDGGQPERNLRRAVAAVDGAADAGCRIVVLPECLDLGWTDPSARTRAESIPGPHTAQLSEVARRREVYVAAGLVERAGDALYNAAVLIDPAGVICLHHRKINELHLAHDLYAVGDRLGVVHTPLGTMGLNVCADNFPDSLAIGHVLGRMGAQLLLSPSAWAVDANHDNRVQPYGDLWKRAYTELGQLYDMTVVGVSCVGRLTGGPWKGRLLIGCSLAVGPGGTILAEAPYGAEAESMVTVELELGTPIACGTEFAEILRKRGYEGP